MFTVYAILIVSLVLLSSVTFNGRSPLLVENAPKRRTLGEYCYYLNPECMSLKNRVALFLTFEISNIALIVAAFYVPIAGQILVAEFFALIAFIWIADAPMCRVVH